VKRSCMEAELYCIHCREESPFTITYINDKLKTICCTQCHHAIDVRLDLQKEFKQEWQNRILSKPSRMTTEYKDDLSQFLFTLPIRLASKPYRLYQDIKESRIIMRDFKDVKHW